MSTRAEHSIDDVLTTEELEKLGKPDVVKDIPDAQVAQFEDTYAVTTPGSSIASSMDRFKAGNITPAQQSALEGFYGEFTENRERVVFVDDEIRELLGDEAVVKFGGVPEAYAVRVADPSEAADVVEKYDEQYAGNPSEYFWNEVESNRAVIPVIKDRAGVKDHAPISLMSGDGILRGENGQTAGEFLEDILHRKPGELSEEDLEDTTPADPTELATQRYEAADDSEAEYVLDVMVPAGYDNAEFDTGPQSLIVESGDQRELISFPENPEIVDYEENNRIYTVRIK